MLSTQMTNNITHIVHIADLHIRTGDSTKSRYQEYSCVFDNLYQDLSTFQPIIEHRCIIVIAGDLFHNKLKIESPGLKLILKFLENLASLCDIFVIKGNHDYRQDCPSEPDLVESLLSINIKNVHYIDKTSHVIHKNVGFGIVAIQDALLSGNTSGINHELPDFPDATYFDSFPNVQHRIALFHGAVSKTKLPNGNVMEGHNTYPLEWFRGYDIKILGDIHLQQVHDAARILGAENNFHNFKTSYIMDQYGWLNENKPWAYSGSLVQQDYGETLQGHGFLIWDLENKNVSCFHVKNDFGFITLREIDNESFEISIKSQHTSLWKCLDAVIQEQWFPRNVSIRLIRNSKIYNVEVFHKIQHIFQQCAITILELKPHFINNVVNNVVSVSVNDVYDDITSFNTPESWIDFIQTHQENIPYTHWKDWFRSFDTIKLPLFNIPEVNKMHEIINDKNTKLQKIASVSFDSLSYIKRVKKQFFIKQIEWDYILCFKDNNYFNFDNNKHSVNAITAPNACGKTNFLETICIAIYGKGLPSRTNISHSSAFISNDKPENVSAQTTIFIDIQSQIYRIKRIFQRRANDESKKFTQSRNCKLDKLDEASHKFINIKSGNLDEWIHDNIGSFSAFLTSCLISQNFDMDFFSRSSLEQKQMLDDALHVSSSSYFLELLKESKNAHDDIAKTTKVTIDTLYNQHKHLLDVNFEEDIKQLQQTLDHSQNSKTMLSNQYETMQKTVHSIPDYIQYEKYSKKELQDTINGFDDELAGFDTEVNKCYEYNKLIDDIASLNARLKNTGVCPDLIKHHKLPSVEKKIAQLKRSRTETPSPDHSLDDIKLIERQYQIWETSHLHHEHPAADLLSTVTDRLKENAVKKESNDANVVILQKQLTDLYNAQPLQTRSDDASQYDTWLKNIHELRTKYQTLQNLVNIVPPRPSSSFDEVLKIYTTKHLANKRVEFIDTGDNLEDTTNLVHSLKRQYSKLQEDLLDSNKHQPLQPRASVQEYKVWKAKKKTLLQKYKSIDALRTKIKDLRVVEQPHTSKSKLTSDLKDLSKTFVKYKKYAKMTGEYPEIENQLLLTRNNINKCNASLLVFLENKPCSPPVIQEVARQNSSYVHNMFGNDIHLIQTILKQLYEYQEIQQKLQSRIDDNRAILLSVHDHEYNPDCWSCQKNPINLQKQLVQNNISENEINIQQIKNKIIHLVGETCAKDIEHTISFLQYEIDYDKIVACEKYSENIASLKMDISSLTQKEIDLRDRFENVTRIMQIQNEMRVCKDMIGAWKVYDVWNKHFKHYTDEIKSLEDVLSAAEFWNEELQRRSLFDDWKLRNDTIIASIQTIQTSLAIVEQKYLALEDYQCVQQYNVWNQYNALSNDIQQWTILNQEEEFWKEEEQRKLDIHRWKNDIAILEERISNGIKNGIDLETIITNLEITSKYIGEYTSWQVTRVDINAAKNIHQTLNDIDSDIALYQNIQSALELLEEHDNLLDIAGDINRCKEIEKVYDSHKLYIKVYDDWEDIKNQYGSVHILDEEINDIKINLSLLKRQQQDTMAHIKTLDIYKEYFNLISIRKDTLFILYESFGKYSKWLYSEKIIPYIQNATNSIILEICASRPLSIQCEINHKVSGTSFNWFLKDASLQAPPIEKASGFQRFIAGLAIRIALGKIGASGIRPSQLFLDEGFTSCDSENIHAVGPFLHTLLNHYYEQIIIVSHLDEVNACAQNKITITRNPFEKYSSLQYGIKYLK